MKHDMLKIGLVVALISISNVAVAASTPQEINGATFITGGIGDEDLSAMNAVKSQYNLHVTNAGKKAGAYISEVSVAIRDQQGTELFNTVVEPLLFVKLPAGRYTVEATRKGTVNKKDITITQGKSTAVDFTW